MAYELSALGISGIQEVADHLADFGRFGDGYVVHASKGETVIPLAVLDENPRLKAALFTQMRDMGLDPKRYVVGDKLNSINPVTGQPEFFLKKLFKGLKNVVKAIAPVVLPVALSMTRLGPIFGAAAGTGIASLVGGASVGRSLKNAVVAGGIGGLYAGLSGAQAAGKGNRLAGFKSGVSDALTEPFMPRPTRTAATTADRTLGEADASPIDATSEIRPITAAEASAPFGGQLQPLGVTEGNLPFAGSDFQLQARNPLFGQTTPQTGPFGTFSPASPPSSRYSGGIDARGQGIGTRLPFEPLVQTRAASSPARYGTAEIPEYVPPSRTIISGGPSGSPSYIDPNTGVTTYGIASDPGRGAVALGDPYSGEAFTNRNALGLRGAAPIFDHAVTLPPRSSTIGGLPQSVPVGGLPQSVPVGGPPQGPQGVQGGGEGGGERSGFARTGDYLFRGGLDRDQVLDVKNAAYKKVLDKTGNEVLANEAFRAAGPNMLQKWGPSTALGLAAAGAFGAFKQGKEPDPIDYYAQEGGTAAERLRDNPGLFSVGTPHAYVPATLEDIRYNAVGGPINQDNFPRRIGPINGAGTGTSDDIRAMLSDGEYVMTAKAVRGAGNGNRKQGMNNMYNMMRQFEGQAV
tara:strand:- start:723 stop:2618 length:1896 start_codon:yes stop_codon:yes gene_type:complete